jgi:hypothetical protein
MVAINWFLSSLVSSRVAASADGFVDLLSSLRLLLWCELRHQCAGGDCAGWLRWRRRDEEASGEGAGFGRGAGKAISVAFSSKAKSMAFLPSAPLACDRTPLPLNK